MQERAKMTKCHCPAKLISGAGRNLPGAIQTAGNSPEWRPAVLTKNKNKQIRYENIFGQKLEKQQKAPRRARPTKRPLY